MNAPSKRYAAAVVTAGVIALWLSLTDWESRETWAFTILLILTLWSSSLKLRIPMLEGTYSANFVFILIGVGVLSRPETMLLAIAGALAQTLWHPARRPTLVQVMFNVSNLSLSTLIAYSVPRLVLPDGDSRDIPLLLAVASALYFVVNTVLVSGVMARIAGDEFQAVWRRWHLWSFPYYAGGAVIAGIAILAASHSAWRSGILTLPLVYLVYRYFANIGVGTQLSRRKDQSFPR
jgi:hypothetical protein